MDGYYYGAEIILTTKHAKGTAIGPIFEKTLGAKILECQLDTDLLGTFSGEVHRTASAVETAKRKCLWGLESTNQEYGLASEGSFGPHPAFSFMPCDHEILYFIDKRRDFSLHLSLTSEKTNYWTGTASSIEDIERISSTLKFPSHALVIRPNQPIKSEMIFKGVSSYQQLNQALTEAIRYSNDSQARVETDMRAHMNPTRMEVIGELAANLAARLANHCSACRCPGWGIINVLPGLGCEVCGSPTQLIKEEIFGCVKCPYTVTLPASHGLAHASAMRCDYCTP